MNVSGSYMRIINVALRFATLVVRFAFIFALSLYLPISDVGIYGVMASFIMYGSLIFGLDYSLYANREITSSMGIGAGQVIKSQVYLHSFMYIIAALVVTALVNLRLISDDYIYYLWWMLILSILDHVNVEIGRTLNAMSDQVSATISVFIRTAVPAVISILLMVCSDGFRSLFYVFTPWLILSFASMTYGIYRIKLLPITGWGDKVDWISCRRGIFVGLFLFLSTLSFKAPQVLDRIFIENSAGIQAVGAYVLFYGVATSLIVFLEASTLLFIHPELIKNSRKDKIYQFSSLIISAVKSFAVSAIVFSILSFIAVRLIVDNFLGEEFSSHKWMYLPILLFTVMNGFNLIFNAGLYAKRMDRFIVICNFSGLTILISTAYFMMILGVENWAIASLMMYYAFLAISKLFILMSKIKLEKY